MTSSSRSVAGPSPGRVAAAVAVAVALAWILVPLSPAVLAVPGRDAGAFLYIGGRLLEGATPYVDLWDHKGPVLHLWNAAERAVPLPGLWGPFAFRAAWIVAAALAWGTTVRRRIGLGGAVYGGVAAALLLPVLLEGGNLTEEIAAVLTAFAVYARLGRDPSRVGNGSLVLVGALGAAAFLTRQNLVGSIGVLAAIEVFRGGRSRVVPRVAAVAVGGAGLAGGVLLWLAARGAIGAWWTATWTYNRAYSSGSLVEHAATTVRFVLGRPLLALAVALAAAGAIVWAGRLRRADPATPLVVWAAVSAVVESASTTLSGNAYLHYFVAVVPAAAVLAAGLVGPADGTRGRRPDSARALTVVGWLAILPLAALGARAGLATLTPSPTASTTLALADWIDRTVPPDGTVFVWGAEASVSVLSGRRSPEPYFYAYPLLRTGFERHRDVEAFVGRMRARPPAAIVDTSATNALVPPLDRRARAGWHAPDPGYRARGLDPLFEFVESGYRPAIALGRPAPWIVWLPRDDAPDDGR